MVKPKQRPKQASTNNGGKNGPKTPLMPSGVNNKATMPKQTQTYTVSGEEVLAVVNVASGSAPGDLVFDQQISHDSVARLSILASTFQRVRWHNVVIDCVPVNGSVVKSGYNFGFVEDPEVEPPTSGTSGVIPFMTALRGTSVRQNWVQSTTGQTVKLSDLPEMYSRLGSDVRRYYIGRALLAMTGDVGADGATFQILLKYRVTLMVPVVNIAVVPPPVTTYTISADANAAWNEGDSTPTLESTATIPATGVYRLLGSASTNIGTKSAGEVEQVGVSGFRVTTAGGSGSSWGSNTQIVRPDGSFAAWPKSDGSEGSWTDVVGGVQTAFLAGTVFEKVA